MAYIIWNITRSIILCRVHIVPHEYKKATCPCKVLHTVHYMSNISHKKQFPFLPTATPTPTPKNPSHSIYAHIIITAKSHIHHPHVQQTMYLCRCAPIQHHYLQFPSPSVQKLAFDAHMRQPGITIQSAYKTKRLACSPAM